MTQSKKRGSPEPKPTSAKPAAAPVRKAPTPGGAATPGASSGAPGAGTPKKGPAPKVPDPKPQAPKAPDPKAQAPKGVAPKAPAPKVLAPKAQAPKVLAPQASAGAPKPAATPKPVAGGSSAGPKSSKAALASKAPDAPGAKASAKPGKPSKDAPRTPEKGPEKPARPKGWPKGGPSKPDLKRYRDALLARRRELLASSKDLAAEALQAGGGDFSVDHMADHGSDNYEQDFNLKLLEGEAGQLADIRDALAKIDGKAELPFGLCEACADDAEGRCPTCPWIPSSRLDAIPQARLCVQMKEREESRG